MQGNDFSDELHKANQQIKSAWIAGIISGVVTMLIYFFALRESIVFMSALLVLGLTFGIYKKSRACAVILLSYFVFDKIVSYSMVGLNTASIPFAILFVYFFAQGVRGTFTYHRLTKSQP